MQRLAFWLGTGLLLAGAAAAVADVPARRIIGLSIIDADIADGDDRMAVAQAGADPLDERIDIPRPALQEHDRGPWPQLRFHLATRVARPVRADQVVVVAEDDRVAGEVGDQAEGLAGGIVHANHGDARIDGAVDVPPVEIGRAHV